MPACPHTLDKLLVYRIEHYQNLPYILRHGMHTRGHPAANPNHVFIGNADLTGKRDQWPLRPEYHPDPASFGVLGDYVPFYFGPRSPMLYNIKTGWDVPQRDQREIVYVVCRVQPIAATGHRFAFTDGHAKALISATYADLAHLDKLFWDDIYARMWNNEQGHEDRQRRKQAEFLVHGAVPPEWIEGLVVFDEQMRTFAEEQAQQAGRTIKIVVNPLTKSNQSIFYY